ncbi:hypothetical protein GGR56DRAFT_302617 [Xylariaceae sp. FL0804]|nr:hypothetical protein GGR56DRAFT_302617 [Xylariaceae sp. FL0804]
MRPIPGDDAWIARPRPADHADPSLLTTAAGAHGSSRMSFVIADEASVDAYLEQPTVPLRFRDPRKADRDDRDAAARRSDRDTAPPQSPSFRTSNVFRSPATPTSQGQMSRPMTPIMLGTSCTGSVLSSRRNSLAGSFSDHASISDEEPMMDSMASDMMDSGSAPQLVMPSIQMPSRRPFTEAGKNLGRLKVMLAGDSGSTYPVSALVFILTLSQESARHHC